jgi:hypothetical protein
MARVYTGQPIGLDRVLGPLERLLYRLFGIQPDDEQHWKAYAGGLLLFNLFGVGLLYVLQRIQIVLPLNPAAFAAPTPDAAFNVAVSFVTNTNWQNYGGEATYSYFVQMAGLTTQNFLSAATGISVLVAVTRGFAHLVEPFHNRQYRDSRDRVVAECGAISGSALRHHRIDPFEHLREHIGVKQRFRHQRASAAASHGSASHDRPPDQAGPVRLRTGQAPSHA